ncbi:tannase/feruloyl esterase family alpha/beta hydrolase [Caldimonas tepidiphila]|uniref:tannase/feruloyl esterase family alpha/beta hydrolase n=1 Tax=Caldimonas tepidiphila TaxID=2315841 RepID=UPI001F0BB4B6|nr:tannase/feruloyl esterase family alpha/beta hydrolase [Caldimonas tepidiphila]
MQRASGQQRWPRRFLRPGVGVAAALLVLHGAGIAPGADGAPDGGGNAASACAGLAGLRIDAARIGLPTSGATVDKGSIVAAGEEHRRNGAYCKVEGRIHPVDARAPPIRFQLNLPARWNGKAVQMGGSGYNGTVAAGTGQIDMTPYFPPLWRGYATFGSDSGHERTDAEADFALDEEALRNFGWQHLKKTRDAALHLLRLHYGGPARRVYFAGASTGGREAFTAIQRFPADYDGIVAVAPALNFSGVRLMGVKLGQAAYRRAGGFVPPVKWPLVHGAGLKACDALDGLEDGIVGDVAGCRARAQATLGALRCRGGADLGSHCLSDAQLATVRLLHEGYLLPYTLAHGVRGYEGYNVLAGGDFSGRHGLGRSPRPVKPPTPEANGYLYAQGDDYMKFFVARDPSFESLAFDLDRPGALRARLVELSGTVGAMNPDLSAFAARGGKAIVMHGLADEVISPNQTIAYYQEVQRRLRGAAPVDGFMRLYTVPGFQHGGGPFVPFWDALGALDRWVDGGVAPQVLEAIDIAAPTQGRTRPLCPHPAFPKYLGRGSPDEASSYACAPP